jgi:hypothetical protein
MPIPSIAIALFLLAPSVAPGADTGIAFADRDGISEWRVAGEDRIYLRDAMGAWYLARTTNPCPRMRSAMALGFDTAGTDRLDRFGAILADGRRCSIASLVRSPAPPGVWKRKGGRR